MNELISIVIAAYNTELYIEECLSSVINQTYGNLEIIIVDDGSTDKTPVICENMQRRDTRIRLVRTNNGGVSRARNIGFASAAGQYVLFVDSDDFLEPDMVEILSGLAKEKKAQVACCKWISERGIQEQPIKKGEIYEYNAESALCSLFRSDSYLGFGWNKLFDVNMLRQSHIEFNEKLFMLEDELFVCEAMTSSEKIVYTTAQLYHYRLTGNSSTRCENAVYNPRLIQRVVAVNEIELLLNQHQCSDSVMNLFRARRMLIDVEAIRNLSQYNKLDHELVPMIQKRIRKNLMIYLCSGVSYGGVQYKIAALLMAVSVKAFDKIAKEKANRRIKMR